jgi:hypothetical protein
METALALEVLARGGPGVVELLEYLVTGEWEPSFDGMSVDRCYPPDEGWVF